MRENIFAHTDCSGVGYPGYVSINRVENGDVEITVRSSPTQRDGVHVCMNQPGPGNCTPGGPNLQQLLQLGSREGADAGPPAAVRPHRRRHPSLFHHSGCGVGTPQE
jgi:hypothetical protein